MNKRHYEHTLPNIRGSLSNTYKGESIFIETRKFNANRDYLWAIPLEEVDLAQGALKQNPGWD